MSKKTYYIHEIDIDKLSYDKRNPKYPSSKLLYNGNRNYLIQFPPLRSPYGVSNNKEFVRKNLGDEIADKTDDKFSLDLSLNTEFDTNGKIREFINFHRDKIDNFNCKYIMENWTQLNKSEDKRPDNIGEVKKFAYASAIKRGKVSKVDPKKVYPDIINVKFTIYNKGGPQFRGYIKRINGQIDEVPKDKLLDWDSWIPKGSTVVVLASSPNLSCVKDMEYFKYTVDSICVYENINKPSDFTAFKDIESIADDSLTHAVEELEKNIRQNEVSKSTNEEDNKSTNEEDNESISDNEDKPVIKKAVVKKRKV